MIESIDTSLVDWSRAQFALTAIYHWLFVPLTLGLAIIMGITETLYVKTGKEFWKYTTKFWMKLFGINFAVGVATGLILEFEFGTNWSNYSWFVGDIFGAPLAIEAIVAFFLEATFIAVMFFGWNKVSKRFHLTATWLTGIGATLSAWWILVANAWMQYPVGMVFNPETVRNEMDNFIAVAFSPVAVMKFFHTVLSSLIIGAVFVIGISCWYLIKKRNQKMALASIKVAAFVGLCASLITAWTGDQSGYQAAKTQPMKLAAMEGLYEGGYGLGLTVIGFVNPDKKTYDDGVKPILYEVKIPKYLSFLATREANGYVPGIRNLIEGGYPLPDGSIALSAEEKIASGKKAIAALDAFRQAQKDGNKEAETKAREMLQDNMAHFGYGYIQDVNQLIPNVPLNFYAFRIMVGLGFYFILLFAVLLFLIYKKDLTRIKWIQWLCLLSIPLAYIASQAGWVVTETGRQPWAIQNMLPTNAAVSRLQTSSVQLTFFLFLILFTILLIAEINIMLKAIKKGPEGEASTNI